MFVKACIVLIASASLCQSIDVVQRIKDGKKVVRGDFTFTAKIKRKGSTVCAGSLIDRRYILTLKNCIKERSLREYTVYFTNSKDRTVERSVRYVDSLDSSDDRLILVRLNKKIRRSQDNVRPFDRFFPNSNEMQLTNCKAVGYSANGNVLNEVKINIKPAKSCRDIKKERTLCLDTVEGKICKVDNGAPIICKLNKKDKKWYLTGLSSVTKNCKDKSINALRLSYFFGCIIKTINGKQGCCTVPIIPFGTAQLDIPMETDVGSTASVTCQSGYETDSPVITCQEGGMWSATTCDAIDCGTVPIIPFGTAQLDIPMETDVGSTATISCQSGYETDSPSITCQGDGMWSATTCDATVAVNASLGEPCNFDRDCIDNNSTCNNGFCGCESGTANITGTCKACVVSTYDCIDLLTKWQATRCIVCWKDDCVEGEYEQMKSANSEVLNPAVCKSTEVAYNSSCGVACDSDPLCFWMSTDSASFCRFYSRDCAFRLTLGNQEFRFLKGC